MTNLIDSKKNIIQNNRYTFFILFYFCFTAVMSAGGNKEESTIVEVSGIVRLVGSAPFHELVITGLDGEWYIAKEDDYKLKDLQYRTVTIQGEETVAILTFANGFPAGERRTLKNIKIIKAYS